MFYYSTKNKTIKVDFRQAAIEGQAPDKGLYFPDRIPKWDDKFKEKINELSKAEIGFEIMQPYVGQSISKDRLEEIIQQTLAFEFPLKKINESIYCLELFQGPTLAFKDVGARFMSRCLGYFSNSIGRNITVLVATSGDTGGAVADAFYNVKGTQVIILYPSGKVSPVQEKQLTTLGNNIHAFEVGGDFDDCQKMVKLAFADEELKKRLFLTSANSINVARWLPQQIYYALAMAQWNKNTSPVIAVPSGNFGNLCAGLLAQQSGLNVKHFIAACNTNDAFTKYLYSGEYSAQTAVATVSNAMDVGNPSNFERILELYNHELKTIKNHVSSISIDDFKTTQTIEKVFNTYDYLLDPHTAVAYHAMENWLMDHPEDEGIILGTAHPVKFPTIVEKTIGKEIELPDKLASIMKREKKSILVEPNYESIRSQIIQLAD